MLLYGSEQGSKFVQVITRLTFISEDAQLDSQLKHQLSLRFSWLYSALTANAVTGTYIKSQSLPFSGSGPDYV